MPLSLAAASWRDSVQAARESCGYSERKMIEVQIDSEMLQNSKDDMALLSLAADLQQHRRLGGLSPELDQMLDKKARGIGELARAVLKSRTTAMLMNSLRPRL